MPHPTKASSMQTMQSTSTAMPLSHPAPKMTPIDTTQAHVMQLLADTPTPTGDSRPFGTVHLRTAWGGVDLHTDDGTTWRHPYPLGSLLRPFLGSFAETPAEVRDFIAQVAVEMLNAGDVPPPCGHLTFGGVVDQAHVVRDTTTAHIRYPIDAIPWGVCYAGQKLGLGRAWDRSPYSTGTNLDEPISLMRLPFPVIVAAAQMRTAALITERLTVPLSGTPGRSAAYDMPDPDEMLCSQFVLFPNDLPYMGEDGLSLHRYARLVIEPYGPALFDVAKWLACEQHLNLPASVAVGRALIGERLAPSAGWVGAYLLTLDETDEALRKAIIFYLANLPDPHGFVELLADRALREITLRKRTPGADCAIHALRFMLLTDHPGSDILGGVVSQKVHANPELRPLLTPALPPRKMMRTAVTRMLRASLPQRRRSS